MYSIYFINDNKEAEIYKAIPNHVKFSDINAAHNMANDMTIRLGREFKIIKV